MDKTELVEEVIKDGERLIKALDEDKFDVRAAMWFYLTDSNEWRLIIASPFVDKNGPKKSYEFILRELIKLSKRPLAIFLKNVSVISPQDDLISLLRSVIHTGPGISGIRFTRNAINNVLIEDAYIYRMS